MSDKELLDSAGDEGKWKNKYNVEWCALCEVAAIVCPICKNSSCGGGGCKECMEDLDEWNKTKHCLEQYLPPNEVVFYEKCQQLKRFMIKSLQQSEHEINWKKSIDKGELSSHDEVLFKDLIKENKL